MEFNKSGAKDDSGANAKDTNSANNNGGANNTGPMTMVPMIPASTEWRCAHGKGTGDCQACLQREPWLFYDVVLYNGPLRCLGEQTDPFQLRDKNTYHVGWKIVCRKSIIQTEWPSNVDSTQHVGCALPKNEVGTVLNDMTGVLVNVMGSFNRGKTWLLDQLCKGQDQGVALPAGMCMSTPGISAKCAKVDEMDLVLVDMQGSNTPIASCKQKDMTLATTEEQFLRAVVSKLCNNFLFVVGKMTMTDQKDLLGLCKLCKSQDGSQQPNKKIFVVHNFMDVTTEEAFTTHIQEVSALLGSIDKSKEANDKGVPRSPGTIFTHDDNGKGIIEKCDGLFVHVEWENKGQHSFPLDEWQRLVQQHKIHRVPLVAPAVVADQSRKKTEPEADNHFAEELYKKTSNQPGAEPRTIRFIRGHMDGVEQVHFFLARNPSVSELQMEAKNGTKSAGTNWNEITIEFLRSSLITSGKRTTGEGKDPHRFNYLVQLTDAFAKVMAKVFRPIQQDGAVDEARRPKAKPELMRLRDEGHLRLWANLEDGEPGKCLEFVEEGLMATNFEPDGIEVQHDIRTNRYKRTVPVEGGFFVEQRMFVLEVPGYDMVDTTPCPENEDIEIDDNILEVTLKRKSPMPGDEWNEDGHRTDIHAVEKKILYEMTMGWSRTEITQENGLLTILIHGNRRKARR
jgi:hypothetical protein